MKQTRKRRLEAAGFRVGSVREFLDLSPAEEMYINIKSTLVLEVQSRRRAVGLTQVELAQRAGTSQSRIAKLEAGDPSVSIDLLVRVLIALDVPETSIAATLVA